MLSPPSVHVLPDAVSLATPGKVDIVEVLLDNVTPDDEHSLFCSTQNLLL
jgi:hypothetical protein